MRSACGSASGRPEQNARESFIQQPQWNLIVVDKAAVARPQRGIGFHPSICCRSILDCTRQRRVLWVFIPSGLIIIVVCRLHSRRQVWYKCTVLVITFVSLSVLLQGRRHNEVLSLAVSRCVVGVIVRLQYALPEFAF